MLTKQQLGASHKQLADSGILVRRTQSDDNSRLLVPSNLSLIQLTSIEIAQLQQLVGNRGADQFIRNRLSKPQKMSEQSNHVQQQTVLPLNTNGQENFASRLAPMIFRQNNPKLQNRKNLKKRATTTKTNRRSPQRYVNRGEREIHLNLDKKEIRVYLRKPKGEHDIITFTDLIVGDEDTNKKLKRSYHYTVQDRKLISPHGLINFVPYHGDFGFHSNFKYKKGNDGEKVKRKITPLHVSSGCARIPEPEDKRFYDIVRKGDWVQVYGGEWQKPHFVPHKAHTEVP